MGDMTFFKDEQVQVITQEGDQIEDIVIYCDLCNEPLAITTKLNRDDVYLQCLRCHAVSTSTLKTVVDEPTQEI